MNFFNSLKVGKKIIVGYIAILTLMVTITVVLLYNLYSLTQEFHFLIEHDQPVLTNAHRLEKLVVDMETGERGFLITGKDEFLEPYQKGNTEFEALLEIEKQLVSDNPSQVTVLEEIDRLHNKWIEVAAQPEIAKRREANKATVNADYLQKVLKKGVGKGILDKLRGLLEQLEVDLTNKGKLESVILTVKIARDMVDQETGQRGFIITGEDSFLEPYRHGQTQLATDIAALRQQLTGDSDNLALLSQFETLANEWLEKTAKPEIGARRTMNANPVTINDVATLIQAGTGKNILDAMRDKFTAFVQTETELNTQRTENVQQNVIIVRNLTIGLALGAIIIGMLLGIFISRSITYPLVKLTNMANKMALGDMGQVLNQQNRLYMSRITVRRDEMGDIGRAYDSLGNYFGALIADIVQISQRLAEGGQNAIAKAEYRGDFVQVKNALETAAGKLTEATANQATQNWFKTGQAQLNEQMSGEQEFAILAKKIISFLTTYVEAQVGLFYMLITENEQQYIQIIASYAYIDNDESANKVLVTKGLAGQAVLERKVISLTQTAEECLSITRSGLAGALPKHILLLPFLYEDEVKGVIEIGSATMMTDIQRGFLEQAVPNIGIAVNTAKSRSQMQTLLEQSQRQSEELQSKQAELQHTNEELQSQSEELQTQQEELRQTNEALEGRTQDLERQKLAVQGNNQALSQTHTEMEQAKLAIEAKAKELALASKYKSEFLANMSHELRTPLNSLLILAKLLADNKSNNLTAKQVEYATTIHSAGNDLLTLINDILDLSKIEAGKIEVQWEDVSLSDLLTMVEQKFRHVAEGKKLVFQIVLAEDIPSVHTDGQRLKQIINNLLSNAFKFTSTGEIKVMAQRPTNIPRFSALSSNALEATKTVAISVSDTGIGIPQDKQQVIFEAFQQADGTTSRSYGGTGLGLSISRQLARLLGGELTLESEKGKGTTFTLYLPIGESQSKQKNINQVPQDITQVIPKDAVAQDNQAFQSIVVPKDVVAQNQIVSKATQNEVVPEPAVVQKPPITDDRNAIQPSDKSILIVEDDQKFSNILSELAHSKGFKCLIAGDGISGLQIAEEYKPHAIILDVGLPQLDGFSVMERLKDNPETRHIPVHFISAAELNMDAQKMGAIGYLTKPVSMEQLGKALQNIEQFLSATVKNLLVITDIEFHQQKIVELVDGEHIQIQLATTIDSVCQQVHTIDYDCIILDMDIENGSGNKLLEQMQQEKGSCQIPIIVYANRELTSSEEALLLRCADELPLKSAQSPERLLDEATLFLHQVEANLPTEKRQMLQMVHDKTKILRQKKVLIIDDDMRNTFAITTVLEDYDMEVVIGANGKEGLVVLNENEDIAIVLMDIMMPEMDGYEAIRKIREQPRYQHLPIIALTAKAMKGDRAKCIEAGANDYLAKPVDTDKLLSLMRVWLYR